MPTHTHILTATALHKHYFLGGRDLHVLRGVDVAITRGQWLAITGASGSGKSTLLHLMGGLDRPDEGHVFYDGDDVFSLKAAQVDSYRSRTVGFVFQFYHLLPELTAVDNVMIGGMINRSFLQWPRQRRELYDRACTLLEQMNLGDRMDHRPAKLSGGERQRVAIARALINEPAVLLADEPTGNLDEKTGEQILGVFRDLHAKGQTIVMVTHDPAIAAAADRVLHLERGRLK